MFRGFVLMLLSALTLAACSPAPDRSLPVYSPVVVERHFPEKYPDILQRAGLAGKVEMNVLIDEAGNVSDVKVVQSIPIVDSVCIEAVKTWKFKPGTVPDSKGQYVPAKFWFPVIFDWDTGSDPFLRLYP